VTSSQLRSFLGLGVLGLALAVPAPAAAEVYPVEIHVDNEEDLRSLYSDGLIDDRDFEVLLELLNNPLDLNRASVREVYELPGISYRTAQALVTHRRTRGRFTKPEDLLVLSGMTSDVLTQIEPFIEVNQPKALPGWKGVSGLVRFRTALEIDPEDPVTDDHAHRTHTVRELGYGAIPNSYLGVRARYGREWKAGFLGLAQEGINDLVYSPETGDFHGTWGRSVGEFGKGFVTYEQGRGAVVVGSYTAGFGLGLTFDRTSRQSPDGWYADLSASGVDRFSLPRGLFGVAAKAQAIRVGPVQLDATVFASSWRYDIYQYDLGVAGGESLDPVDNDAPSPVIYLEDPDGTYQKTGWLRIPNAWREDLVGGHVTAQLAPGTEVGLTGYVGHKALTTLDGVTDPDELILRIGYPEADVYGAFGFDASTIWKAYEFRGELAVTGTGGVGALVKATADPWWGQLEASVRRYGTGFDNPHARGLANADEYGGMRDRDEQGLRLRAIIAPQQAFDVRVHGDVWQNLSTGRTNLELLGRADYRGLDGFVFGAFGTYRNRDLANNGRTRIYGGDYTDNHFGDGGFDTQAFDDPTGTVVDGAGSRTTAGVQLRYDGVPGLRLEGLYKRSYEDAGLLYPNGGEPCYAWFQIGHYGWVRARYQVSLETALTARVRYVDEDVWGSLGDRDLEGYLQLDQTFPRRIKLSARATVGSHLDDAPASWADACESGYTPELEGTCVADVVPDDEIQEGTGLYGLAQLRLEMRF